MTQLINIAGLTSHPNERGKAAEQWANNNILFDSGANVCVTNDIADFNEHYDESSSKHGQIDGIGKGLKILGKGTLSWTFIADNEMYRTLKLPGYYVPTSMVRIASLQVTLRQYPKETVSMTTCELRLNGFENQPSITVPFEIRSNLPVAPTVGPSDHSFLGISHSM